MVKSPEQQSGNHSEGRPVADKLIWGLTARAVDVYKASLLQLPQDDRLHSLPGAETALTGNDVLEQLDGLQTMLNVWINPKENKWRLEPAVRPQKEVGHAKKPTYSIRFKPQGTRLSNDREYAQRQLSLHINLGASETVEAALVALSLKNAPQETLEKYDQERRQDRRSGLPLRERFIAINTVLVYKDQGKSIIIPQAGIEYVMRGDTAPAIVHGLAYIGRTPFTTDLRAHITPEQFAQMGTSIIQQSVGR